MSSTDWDQYASAYDAEPDHGLLDPLIKNKWRELMTAQLPPTPIRIIDMGGGTGTITELLAEAGHQVTFVDSSLEMTKLARKKCQRFGDQITYFTCSVEDLNEKISESTFDVVFGRHILWTSEDLRKTLKTWHSLLSDTGYSVLIEGFWSTGAGIPSETLQREVRAEMGTATTHALKDPLYWGKEIDDERYLVSSRKVSFGVDEWMASDCSEF